MPALTPDQVVMGNLWARREHWPAWDVAEEQLASTPSDVAEFLIDTIAATSDALDPVDTMRIHERDIQGQPVHILLALIMTGTDRQANLARMFLRDAFKKASFYAIGKRATEIDAAAPPPGYFDFPDVGCEFDE